MAAHAPTSRAPTALLLLLAAAVGARARRTPATIATTSSGEGG